MHTAARSDHACRHAYKLDCSSPESLDRQLVPATCELIAPGGTPDPSISTVLTAQLLRLQPNTTIRPHCGMGNFRWVMHLGLSVPSNVTIEVDGVVGRWRDGRIITFDDSYRHTVVHHGDRDRIVLALQIQSPVYREMLDAGELGPANEVRPDLTAAEVAAVAAETARTAKAAAELGAAVAPDAPAAISEGLSSLLPGAFAEAFARKGHTTAATLVAMDAASMATLCAEVGMGSRQTRELRKLLRASIHECTP
eukprot:SAG22_NODE_264_length_13353_cov_34.575298_6_plen_253_part_00